MPRLFFALWPDPAVRVRLAGHCDPVIKDYRGRPTQPDTLHMTLAFLGDIPELRVPLALGCGDRVKEAPFTLNIDARAHFARARVAWLGCAHPPAALHGLANALRRELGGTHFTIGHGDSPFKPHITIARDCRAFPPPKDIPAIEWRVESFVLVNSTPVPGGVVYRVLKQWPLHR